MVVVLKVYLVGDECCPVRAGDTLGLVNAEAVSSQFTANDLGVTLTTGDADQLAVGDHVTFDRLVFPYTFSLAAAYDTGLLHHTSRLITT